MALKIIKGARISGSSANNDSSNDSGEFKILSGGKKEQKPQEQMNDANQNEGWGSTISRNLGSTALKAAGNLESLLNLLSAPEQLIGQGLEKLYETISGKESPIKAISSIGNELGFNKTTPEILDKSGLLPENYLEARNLPEHFIQTLGSQLPFSGGNKLVSALGAAGNTAAKAAGFGPTGQAVAQLATELPSGLIKSGFRPKGVSNYKSTLYEGLPAELTEESKMARQISPHWKKVRDQIGDINKHIASPEVKNQVQNAAKIVEENFPAGKGNALDAFNARKAIYEYRKDVNRAAYPYLKSMTESLNEFIQKEANPSFFNKLSEADKLHMWQNSKSEITKYLEQFEPIARVLDLPYLKKFSNLASLIYEVPEKYIYQGFIKNPQIRKYIIKTTSSAALDRFNDAGKYASIADKMLRKDPNIKKQLNK